MNIAIDYDGTFTEDQEMWKEVMKLMKDSGHNVYCITKRYRSLGKDICESIPKGIKIIFVKTKYKIETTNRMNIKIDVWIDDQPSTVNPVMRRFTPISRNYR